MVISSHQRDWEELGTLDPMSAVATDPRRKFGGWATANDEFFNSGETVVSTVLQRVRERGYSPGFGAALDFGCGVGRLTRALARRFEQCEGVDIASSMIAAARRMNVAFENCRFSVNTAP